MTASHTDRTNRTVTAGESGDAATDAPADAPTGDLSVPDGATPEEAAAIAAAVRAHLVAARRRARARARAREPTLDEREARQWVTATRLREVGTPPGRMLADAPADPWAADGRACSRW